MGIVAYVCYNGGMEPKPHSERFVRPLSQQDVTAGAPILINRLNQGVQMSVVLGNTLFKVFKGEQLQPEDRVILHCMQQAMTQADKAADLEHGTRQGPANAFRYPQEELMQRTRFALTELLVNPPQAQP